MATVYATCSSVRLLDMHDPKADLSSAHFDPQLFYRCLPEHVELGSTLLTARQLQSTQSFLQNNMAVVPNNSVCIAYQQNGGKGASHPMQL